MNPDEITKWLQLANALTALGFDAAMKIRSLFEEELTEEKMNEIIDAVIDDARRRKALADADSNGPSSEVPNQ